MEMNNEIEKYAEIIGVTVEEATAIFNGIVTDNNLDVNTENGLKVARSVFRSKFSQARTRMMNEQKTGETQQEYTGPTYTQRANGFFWAADNATNWEERNRNTLLAEYQRDANTALNSGKIAVAVLLSDGRYEVSILRDGEVTSKIMEKLPNTEPMQVDDDRWIIPVDNRKAFQSGQANPNYGRPLPAERWSKTLYFVGKFEDNAEYSEYQLRLNGEMAKNFSPNTFVWCSLDVVPNSNNPKILSARKDGSTAESLQYLDSDESLLEVIQNVLGDKVSSLVSLDDYHSENSHKAYADKLVITDGNVANMKLEPNSNGTRVLHLSDLNADFDYEGEGYSSVTAWIPPSIDIDFGIGSNVIVSGRTSQGVDEEGQIRPATINVLGLHVVDRHGSADVYSEPVEDSNDDWFSWD
tara:strand:+ start:2239 stop:3471 length:1233 start_codon:yes stop_codon:yes gene_type:complete